MQLNENKPHSPRLLPTHDESARLLGKNDTSPSAGMTSAYGDSEGILLSLFCFIVLIPCMLAACAQSIYCVKKRRQDRLERQLLAVSTNPTSRMLVLSEIFKDDGRPVTEDEAYVKKKKRVLVKKHRKRTQEELTDWININIPADSFNPSDDTEMLERYRENSAESDIEDQMNESCWDEIEGGIFDRERPMIVFFSGNVDHAVIANDEHPLEQENVSTLDQYDADRVSGSVTSKMKSQCISIQPDVECGERAIINDNIYASKDEDNNERVIDSNPEPMVSSMPTGLSHYVEEKNMFVSDENSDSCVEKMERITAETLPCLVTPDRESGRAFELTSETSLTILPNVTSNNPPDSLVTPDRELECSFELTSGTSPTSLPDVTLDELNNPPDIPFLGAAETPSSYLSPRALSPQKMIVGGNTDLVVSGLRPLPDLSDDDSDDGDARRSAIVPLFRATYHSTPEICTCGSDVTEVTSNIDGKEIGGWSAEPRHATLADGANDTDASRYHQFNAVNHLGDEVIPVIKSESYNSTDRSLSSAVSYFSYEDVSVASEESEMCAICLCAYEEGDIRIFSKKCSHAFHKDCILEWLIKSQQCPCCRIDMVSKSEIKEISASLIGTERLAQAMAIVNGSGMQEGVPFRARRPRLGRHFLSVARSPMRLSFSAGQSSPSATRSRAVTHFNNAVNLHTSPSTRTDVTNTHSRDWIWTNRFVDEAQPRTINPSRSSDAIMNPHESHQSNTESVSGIPTTVGGISMHSSTAGSLFSANNSIFHDHWQQTRTVPSTPNSSQNVSIFHNSWQQPRVAHSTRRNSNNPVQLHISSAHPYWRQRVPSNSESNLPVISLPAI